MRRLPILLCLLLLAPGGARATTSTLAFRCGGGLVDGVPSIEAMESEYAEQTTKGPCWFHLGHHTYDIGREVALGRIRGSMFSVEEQFSPPIETTSAGFAVIIETSRDGLAWTEINRPTYVLAFTRQTIAFDFDAGGAVARYVRIRQPLSAAQGLSGYIDSSNFDADVTEIAQPAPRAVPTTLNCAEHIMERVWSAHPCWFGGINRWDAPSVFHTYPVGGATLTNIAGAVTVLPWRSDDYNGGGGGRTAIAGLVQTSVDGSTWRTASTFSGTYGVPIAFSVAQPSIAASYVRLVAEYHRSVKADPALKHVRGFIVDSSLTLTTA